MKWIEFRANEFTHKIKNRRRCWNSNRQTQMDVDFFSSQIEGPIAKALRGAAKAQWNCLHLPSCGLRFESQAHHRRCLLSNSLY